MSLRLPEDDRLDPDGSVFATPRVADTAVLIWVAVAGVGADVAVRAGLASPGTALLVAIGALGLAIGGRVRRTQALLVAGAAPVIGCWLAVRTSPWLIVPDVGAAAGLLILSATLQAGGDLFDLDVPRWLRRAGAALAHIFAGAASSAGGAMAAAVTRRGSAALRPPRLGPLLRGAAVAIPVLMILGALLRSADPVFASFLSVRLDGAGLTSHLIVALIGAWAMGGLLHLASSTPPGDVRSTGFRLGTTEAVVVLGAVDILFGLFAIAQLVAAAGGAHHVIGTTGLTYAEYARSGYFQLLWVAGLALGLLVVLDTVVDRPRRTAGDAFGVTGAVAAALTILIALVAFHRLALYEHAFGLTMLRLCCQVFVVWITVVFVLLGLWLLGAWRGRDWFVGAAAMAGLVLLLAFNVANPEALVARDVLRRGPDADVAYLTTLSDDAVPTVVAHLADLSPEAVLDYRAIVCGAKPKKSAWPSLNLSRSQAERAIARLCP